MRARDQAPAFVEKLTSEFIPDFYFFDSPVAGHRYIARELRMMGTTVYLEPSGISTKADLESVSRSDIIKFSDENVPDVSFADVFKDKLFVQTCAKTGYASNYWVVNGRRSRAYLMTISLTRKAPVTGPRQPSSTVLSVAESLFPSGMRRIFFLS